MPSDGIEGFENGFIFLPERLDFLTLVECDSSTDTP